MHHPPKHEVPAMTSRRPDIRKFTPWKVFTESGRKYRIRAEYGFNFLNPRASFGITAEIQRGPEVGMSGCWQEDSFGCQHEAIAKHFPELVPLIRWHLMFTDGPMHYIANARYWWDIAQGKISNHSPTTDPMDAFRSTIVWGVLPEEQGRPFNGPGIQELGNGLEAWLSSRLERLIAAFRADVERFGFDWVTLQ
jgi:hypothetical protein